MDLFGEEGNIVYLITTTGVNANDQGKDKLPRMYMEYMEGGSLEKKIAEWSQVRQLPSNVPNDLISGFVLTWFYHHAII
jgi:hypothetical protein